MTEHGSTEGEICGRGGCDGVIAEHEVENCSCHISPPCSACTTPREFCPACGWEARDEIVFNDYVVQVDRETGVFKSWKPRPLDATKIDWRSKSHTHSSMIKEGVYPPGTSSKEVEAVVRGTFGGRFLKLGGGLFEYLAYTD